MRFLSGLMVLSLTLTTSALAQDVDDAVALHGFGSWGYGRTGKAGNNTFLNGIPDGDFRHTNFALNGSARVGDKLTIHTQFAWSEAASGQDVQLDYAFAEYKVADHASLRFGQVKHPFGIYTEVFAVGTLRPFIDLPQGVYGPVGFVGQAYKGIGLTGTAGNGSWNLAYDLYGGGQNLEKFNVPELYYHEEELTSENTTPELLSTRNVLGGRVVLHTPIAGFSFGGSAYTGILDEEAANRRSVVAGQLEYRSNKFSAESELVYQNQVGDETATGVYAQAAYRFTQQWQVAGQLDYLKNEFFGVDASAAPSLQFHREGAVALNYWFSRSLVLKTEFHRVNGNRFALPHPELVAETMAAGNFRKVTNLVKFGAQFSF